MSDSSLDRDEFELVAELFLARFRAGERPSIEEYAARHPALADQIRELLPAMVMIEQDFSVDRETSRPQHASDASPLGKARRLGDYQILREVGRGGMGIVYEAVQESLGRHVALKVLPWSSVSGGSNLDRFHLEARAAARLHHTNIVPVFGVGEHEGIHYYAMQFIRGESLDEIINEVRLLNSRRQDAEGLNREPVIAGSPSRTLTRTIAEELLSGRTAEPAPRASQATTTDHVNLGSLAQTSDSSRTDSETLPVAAPPARAGNGRAEEARSLMRSDHSDLTASERHYFQGVARIALQVAEALEYAHGQGILHRDIKPSNLLMDAFGTVWVTDFGLAKADGSDGPTRTGDIVGTLRYMAPERFEGQSDPRSDLYAVGATLYELLTLRPAFHEPNGERLIDSVLHREPVPPRSLDSRVPRDLEVISLKCLSKEPRLRYVSAADLRDELKRFLAGEPIRARPSGSFERGWRWARRNPAVAGLLTALAASLLIGFTLVAWQWRRAEGKAAEALEAARTADFQASQALSAAKRAEREANRADEAKDQAMLDKSQAYFDQGRDLAERGEVVRGMFWMIEALRSAPDGRQTLEPLIRANLAAWQRSLVPVGRIFSPAAKINYFSFDAEGGLLVTSQSGFPSLVQQWDVSSGREAGPSFQHPGESIGQLSPDGKTVAVFALIDHSVELRNRATGRLIGAPLRAPHELHPTFKVAGFLDDALAYIWYARPGQPGRRTPAIWFWNVSDGSPAGSLDHDGGVAAVAVGPGGRRIAIGDERGLIRLYQRGDSGFLPGRSLTADHPGERPVSLAFSPDGKVLATGGASGLICLWNLETGLSLNPAIPVGSAIKMLSFSADGTVIFCYSDHLTSQHRGDSTMRFLDAANGRRLAPGARLWSAGVFGIPASGEILLVDDHWGRWFPYRLDLSNLAGSSRPPGSRAPTENRLHEAVISDDRSRALVAGSRRARIIDLVSGLPSCPDIPLRWAGPTRLLLSRDGKKVAVISNNLDVLNEKDRTTDCRIDLRDATDGRPLCPPIYPINTVTAVDFSPDGQRLAVGNWSSVVQLYDTVVGALVGRPMVQAGLVWQVAFSPDGGRLAVSTTADRGAIPGCRVWDLRRHEPIGPPLEITRLGTGFVKPIIQFSPDGERLLIATGTGNTEVWDMQSRRPVHHDSILQVARARPGTQDFLIGTSAGNVRLWDGRTGKPLSPTMRPPNAETDKAVTALDVASDGRSFAAGYDDGTVRIWDLDAAQPVGPPWKHDGRVLAVAFSLDGKGLTSCSADGQFQTRTLPSPVLGSLDRFASLLRHQTGMSFDGGVAVPVTADAWIELHNKLTAEEGWPDAIIAGPEDMARHEYEARRFEQAGDAFAARSHLDRLIRARSDDATLHFRRACTLALDDATDAADAELARAFALDDRQTNRLLELVIARAHDFEDIDRPKASLWALDHALHRRHDDWWLFANRALVHEKLGDLPARDADRDRAVELGADSPYLIQMAKEVASTGENDRANALRDLAVQRLEPGASYQTTMELATGLVRRGRFDDAVNLLDRDHRKTYFGILIRLRLGDLAGYRTSAARLFRTLQPNPSRLVANEIAWPCVLGPRAISDLGSVVALVESAVDQAPVSEKSAFLNTLGAVLYRAGRYSEAIGRLDEGIRLRKGRSLPQDWAFLAMANQAMGDAVAARRWLKKLRDRIPSSNQDDFWEELEILVLSNEAQALIELDPRFPLSPFAP